MCIAPKVDMPPPPPPPAAAPAAPNKGAQEFKMAERTRSRTGEVGPNTARGRSTLRTDLRMGGGLGSGVSVARMGQ